MDPPPYHESARAPPAIPNSLTKVTKNGGQRLREGRQQGLPSPFMDKIHTRATCGLPCCRGPSFFCPSMVSASLNWAHACPKCVPWFKTKKWPYLGLDATYHDSEGSFSLCQSPLWVVSMPQNGTNAMPGVVFACQAPMELRYGVVWPARAHGKRVKMSGGFPKK